MPRALVLLCAAALLGGALFFLLQGGRDDVPLVEEDLGAEDDPTYDADPALIASGGAPRDRGHGRAGRGTGPGATTPVPQEVVRLAGIVVDANTGKPLGDANLRLVPAAEPCPRPADMGTSGTLLQTVSEEDGRFRITGSAGKAGGPIDLFVFREGYVTACVCQPEGKDVRVALVAEFVIAGRVLNLLGRPVEGAIVEATPPQDTPRIPGTTAKDRTDREGRFRLGGLLSDAVMVTAEHPHFMPKTVGPREPGDPTPFEIRLVPAFRVRFQLRTDDGEAVVNPTVRWATDGEPPAADLRILTGTAEGPPARRKSELLTDVVRVPCDRRVVDIEVKADGYMPWTTKREPLPGDGGERTFPVTLSRDASVGALRIRLEDKQGKPLSYAKSGAVANLVWMGPPEQMPSSFVLQAAEALELPSMRAGPYRITIRSADFAPSVVEVNVVAGEQTERKIVVTPPAKLRIRFVAAEALVVHFRITQDGQTVLAFPEGQDIAQPTGETPETLTAAGGGEGLVLSGLGAGSFGIEVTSANLVASSSTVRLTPGETEEVEIEVRRK